MTNRINNPFRPVKFEDETAPLIYVSDVAMQQFSVGNYFFTGKRGCGKTSILRISDTIFRHGNPYIETLPNRTIADETFGTYINLNNRTMPDFSRSRASRIGRKHLVSEQTQTDLTSLYLELTIIRNIVDYCILMRDIEIANLSDTAERLIVSAISEEYKITGNCNIDEIKTLIEGIMTDCIDFARFVRDDLSFYHVRIENRFHQTLGRILTGIRLENPRFKQIRILMDDCETFSFRFQAALNTLIRTPRGAPIAWSIAYVDGRYDPSRTTIPHQTLSQEERTIIYLDGLDPTEYEKFCVEVTRLRIERVSTTSKNFDIRRRLGSFETEELLNLSLRDTVAKRPLNFAKRFEERKDKRITRWQMFLSEHGASDGVSSPDGLRKKGLAAYICICEKYNLPFYYAGFQTVIGLSDGCIRDFLSGLGSIYEAVTQDYEKPAAFTDRVSYKIEEQDRGCRDSADRKLKSINDYAEKHGYFLQKLVHFLGYLAKEFQHDYKYGVAFRTPDRAVFAIQITSGTGEYIDLIKDAEVDGYIRRVEVIGKQGLYCFRLHRQFAPNFNLSYREPANELINIPLYFLRFVKEPETDDPEKWASAVFKNWLSQRSNRDQADFFEGSGV